VPVSMESKFIIYGGGDSDVGIPNCESEITIKDNFIGKMEDTEIQNWKEFLAEYYDIDKKHIYTEEEQKIEEESEREHYKLLEQESK